MDPLRDTTDTDDGDPVDGWDYGHDNSSGMVPSTAALLIGNVHFVVCITLVNVLKISQYFPGHSAHTMMER
jgi:hypothetical protein